MYSTFKITTRYMAPCSLLLTLEAIAGVVQVAAAAASAAATAADAGLDLQPPPLSVVRGALLTTAGEDFGGHQGAFAASIDWHERILSALDRPAPYLACTAPGNNQGLEALSFLRSVLTPGPAGGRVISNSDEHGTCFLATATPQDAETVKNFQINAAKGQGGGRGSPLSYWAPLPSTLKLAPGLLSYGGDRGDHDSNARKRNDVDSSSKPAGNRRNLDEGVERQQARRQERRRRRRLTTIHGKSLLGSAGRDTSAGSEADGLTVELTPGVLAARRSRRQHDTEAGTTAAVWYESSVQLVDQWREALLSESLDVYGASFWSSGQVGVVEEIHWGGNGVGGGLLVREWTRVADVLHELGGVAGGPSVGQVCSWDEMVVYHTDDDLLTLKGED